MSGNDGDRATWRAGWSPTTTKLVVRFLALVGVFVFFTVLVGPGQFCSLRNLENILRQSAVYATAALGMTMVIAAGGIDLSIGSIIALSVVVVTKVLNMEGGAAMPLVALAAAVGVAALAGLLNGAAITGLRILPFVVTLGTMGIYRGLAKGLARERVLQCPETWLGDLMDNTLASPVRPWYVLPPGVWILILAALAAALALRYTRFGRHLYAIGSNEETARLCGVPVKRTKIAMYALCGLFAGLAGLMQFAYGGGVGDPNTAVSYELYVIASVVIGGASLSGGEGTIAGSLIGAVFITVLYMGGLQAGWPKWVQEMVIGAIIITAVAVDRLRRRTAA